MPLSKGTRLGAYEITGPLGTGGMGEVYRAKDLRLGREVAVKVLPEAVASSPDRLARFEREARTIARLNHPNIVVLHSLEEDDGIRFLTMELVEGQSLATLIAPGGLPISRILELAISLTEALVAAHERGIIHRDLKPGNVMVTHEGRVKVLDFGLAKVAGGEGTAQDETLVVTTEYSLSVEGQVLGTAPYMAPEQIRGHAADARSDLFALGIILYELIAGRRPFFGATSADLTSSILRDMPEPLTSLRAEIPGDLERIVNRCLEKHPRERFQTALDVKNELRLLKRAWDQGGQTKAAAPALPSVASIAVLPFVNRSHDAEDEYFSDGLADELLNLLAKIRGLRVAARASAFRFKGAKEDVATIGRKLNVATLLDGSVRKAGNRVRISVQLVKAADGYHLWSETYDRTLDDIFAVQDDIAQSVVKELRAALLGEEADSKAGDEVKAEIARAAEGRRTNPEAHRLYLQARHFIDRFTREDVAKGIGYLKRTLELDPEFALAWAELGLAYVTEADVSWAAVEEGYERAREAIERALSLEPDLAEGHAGIGWIRMNHDWNWRGAETAYRRALELAPGNVPTLCRAGLLAASQGRLEEAIGLFRRALELDPLNASSYHILGALLRMADRAEEAEGAYRKALELTPERIVTHASLSLTLLAQGRDEEALEEVARERHEGSRLWALAMILHALGRIAESDQALHELVEKHAEDWAYQIAEVHAFREEPNAAFEWLERAYAQRDSGLADMKFSTCFRPLYRDPRWGVFMRKMGFEG
jgi:serine/threonine protein kinase/Flp pilus assembly protein TadD